MKLIIAGSRTITEYWVLEQAMKRSGFDKADIEEIVSGCAPGPDTLGERWAKEHGIKVKKFPADWDKHGKPAGVIRNKLMAEYVGPKGALLALWDGESKGTKHMLFCAKGMGILAKAYRPTKKK